jgi:hypothetical protein
MMFELHDANRPNRVLHQEMTKEEADLRNRQLQRKRRAQRWVVCECAQCTLAVDLFREAESITETLCHFGNAT